MERGGSFKQILFLLFLIIITLTFSGCESLKISKPIIPIKEYERLIVGSLDAQYVGTETCLAACHYHDEIRKNFEASTMGIQLSRKSGMPVVNCESCHGPGSLAIEGITIEKVENDAKKGIQTACNYSTFLDIKNLPPHAKSLICLKCHTANATFNLHNWNAGEHAANDVACTDCHNICKTFKKGSSDLTVRPQDIANMCYSCHQEVKAEFSLPSRHPIAEKRIYCTDCHDPHGSINEKLLRKSPIRETCVQCHMDKGGPFVFKHADITEDCNNCHNPHGSINNNLLKQREPFLCLQCHLGHRWTQKGELNVSFYTRCTDCHFKIHGTDLPSSSGRGRFIQ